MSNTYNIHTYVQERVELATFYIEDGAVLSAARIYRELADALEKHDLWVKGAYSDAPLEQTFGRSPIDTKD